MALRRELSRAEGKGLVIDDDLRRQLSRIESKLDALLDDAGIQVLAPTCPHCGNAELENTSAGDVLRMTCLTIGCGKSFAPEVSIG